MSRARRPLSSNTLPSNTINRQGIDIFSAVFNGHRFKSGRSVESRFTKGTKQEEPKHLIIDTDAGTDDAWALFILLQAHRQPNVPIFIDGITCVHGNTTVDNVTVNVTRVLNTVNEGDIPVYRGAESALTIGFFEDPPYHGHDGFGDADLEPIDPVVENEGAVSALIRLLEQNQGKLTIVALGPLTNLALAVRVNPKIHEYPKEILILGGNIDGIGNASTSAEFNFIGDSEAARTVLESFTCPMTILPLETWERFGTSSHEFRTEVLGHIASNKIDLLNKIEANILEKFKDFWAAPDALLAAAIMNPLIATKKEDFYCTVELHGSFTRGMMVVDRKSFLEIPPNVTVITETNLILYEQMLIKAALD